MQKIIYLVIRYSVLIENSRSWNISRTDPEEYRKNLFDENRLLKHFELFKNITFPSILNQTKELDSFNFKLMIITSEDLPTWNKELLEDILSDHSWAEIHYLPTKGVSITGPIENDLSSYDKKILFATIRLDDDDAISNDFFEKFDYFFKEANSGYALSFGLGLCGFYDFNKSQYTKVIEYYYPKFSAGLCYINVYNKGKYQNKVKTIFQAGSHSKVDQKVPTIVDSKEIMFIRTMYDLSDSYDLNRENKLLKYPAVKPKVLEDRFTVVGFNKDIYIEQNFSSMQGIARVDRTKYNNRFDLITGKRIYNYTYMNMNMSFYAEFNPTEKEVLIKFPSEDGGDNNFLENDEIRNFKGTKICFVDSDNSALINKSLFRDFASELIRHNSFDEEKIYIL